MVDLSSPLMTKKAPFDLHQFKIENIESPLSSFSPSSPNNLHNQSQFIPSSHTHPLRCDFWHILDTNLEGTEKRQQTINR